MVNYSGGNYAMRRDADRCGKITQIVNRLHPDTVPGRAQMVKGGMGSATVGDGRAREVNKRVGGELREAGGGVQKTVATKVLGALVVGASGMRSMNGAGVVGGESAGTAAGWPAAVDTG